MKFKSLSTYYKFAAWLIYLTNFLGVILSSILVGKSCARTITGKEGYGAENAPTTHSGLGVQSWPSDGFTAALGHP